MVEINLTSNDGILGIKGPDHPLPFYRKAGVPVALSTDDEGVSRIDLTHEYVRAAQDFNLSYPDLKQMARTGMEHNFLPGKSLWAEEDRFTAPTAAWAARSQQRLAKLFSTPMKRPPRSGNRRSASGNLRRSGRTSQQRNLAISIGVVQILSFKGGSI
jgi:hypothetical protein